MGKTLYFVLFECIKRGWDKSPSLSIVFGLSSKTQWLSGLYYADFTSFYSPTQLCGGGTTKRHEQYCFCPTPYFHFAFYGLCILVFLKQLIIVCDGHLGFFFLIEVLDDVSVFHDNQTISIFQSIFHMVGDHKSCEGILFHKLIR